MKEPIEKRRFKKLLINKVSKEKNKRGLNDLKEKEWSYFAFGGGK